MGSGDLTVALLSDVFPHASEDERLLARLRDARERGAQIALLPELPLDPWLPATDAAKDDDAETPGGPRHARLVAAARQAGIAVVGGAIVLDQATGKRYNTALVVDASGELIASYRKAHLPEEPGFWETSHYVPGDAAPSVIESFPLTFGVQICSDVNRPTGTFVLAGLGAEAVLAPRATELRTYPRWRVVFQANALTSAMYVLSVNRPAPEHGVLIGGPSIAVAPDGQILVETTDPVAVVTLERERVRRARQDYPGYLPVRARLYADAWAAVAGRDG